MAAKKIRGSAILRFLAATLCMVGVVATWVTMAEVLQTFNTQYKQPYFITFFIHSSYSLLYAVWALWRYFPYFCGRSYGCNKSGDGLLTNTRSLFLWSGVLSVLTLLQGYGWYLSLTRTNIPANTAIFQSASAVVFILSVPLLRERVTLLKVVSVLASIGGVSVVAFYSTHDQDCLPANLTNSSDTLEDYAPCQPEKENSTPVGYVLLVGAVFFYALYETLYKKVATAKGDPAATMNGLRVLGYTGIHTLLWLWPPIILLHYVGFEPFAFPQTLELFGFLVLNAGLNIVFFGCLLVCIALSSPLYASVSSIMAVPASVVADLFIHGFLPSWQAFLGIALILAGFSGFVTSELFHIHQDGKSRDPEEVVYDDKVSLNKANQSESEPLLKKQNTKVSLLIKYLI